jgi:propionyl-CoA synthetase
MEEVIAKHPDVAECAVIGASDPFKGQIPVGLVVLKAGVNRDPDKVVTEVVQQVISEIGAVASFRWAYVVNRLPKTRSGKILRGTIRDIADGKPFSIPSTIDDPESLPEIETAVKPFRNR